jgi:hypothetical protein
MDDMQSKRVRALILALCLGLAPGAVAGLPLISEVFYDAVGSDDGLCFVELYGAAGTALDGFVLEGINGSNGEVTDTLTLSGVIPDDGLFVVADALGSAGSLVAEADLVLGFDFQNGPDSVVLRLGADVIDAVGYGDFGPGSFFAGEGTPAPDAPAGASLARRFANLDSGDNFADFAVLDTPSPGSAPLASLPEPGSAVLLLGGLAGLAALGRRRRAPPREG